MIVEITLSLVFPRPFRHQQKSTNQKAIRSRGRTAGKSSLKKDVYQVVTDRIIAWLEAGTVPWHRPWRGGSDAPQNFMSRKAYRGINLLLLNAVGFTSPYWLTFRQVQAMKGSVKKGEKAFPVVFWKLFETEENGETKKFPFLRYHSVFNITQCEGITVPQVEPMNAKFEPIEQCEKVVAEMPRCPIIKYNGNRACYSVITDQVTMPAANQFETPEDYYATLFHELTHSTGHTSRLNRKEITEINKFGSDPYGREELVAEMGAAFLCGHTEIGNQTIQQSADYIQNWLAQFRNDNKLVIQAAAQAQKACDFILNVQPQKDEATQTPQQETQAAQMRECTPSGYMQPRNSSVRQLKIESDGDAWKGTIKPKIRLTGKWLERAGFRPGNLVQVTCINPGIIKLWTPLASNKNK